jgi:hypothetical protein
MFTACLSRKNKLPNSVKKSLASIKQMAQVISLIAKEIDQHASLIEITSKRYPCFNIQGGAKSFSKHAIIQRSSLFTRPIETQIEKTFEILSPYVPAACFTLAMFYIDQASKNNKCFLIHSENALKYS